MKINWTRVAHIGATIVGAIVPGVQVVEQLATQFGSLKGVEKQEAVVELVRQALAVAEGLHGGALANNADVEAATRAVIDAVVALHQVVAHATAAPAR